MIIEWFLGLVAGVSTWFVNLFPDWEAPAFLVDLDTTVNGFMQNVGGAAVWADWGYIIGVVSVVVTVWFIAFVIKIARAVAAHVPFFGGAG